MNSHPYQPVGNFVRSQETCKQLVEEAEKKQDDNDKLDEFWETK